MKPTINDVALGLAREIGWRNVTRSPLLAACVRDGLVDEQHAAVWGTNNFRGDNALSKIRGRLSTAGLPEGLPAGSTSSVWRERTRDLILDEAFRLSTERQQLMIPRWEIAAAVGVSSGLVSLAWGGMDNLRRAVVARAGESSVLGLQAAAIGLTA